MCQLIDEVRFFSHGVGTGGGQLRDDYRNDYDPGRGGYGVAAQQEFLAKRCD